MTPLGPATSLTVETRDGFGDAALITAWDALAARDADATLFQRARWLARWESVLAGQRQMRTRTFLREGRLVGVLCETRELMRLASGPAELIRLAGGDEVTDYLGPVAAPQDRADVADAYVATLSNDRGWDEVVLGGLAADTGWHQLFADAAERHGLVVTDAGVEAVCPRVDLTGGLDAYLGRLPGRMRNELTRKARKLTRDAGPFEVHEYAPDATAEGIEDFLVQVQSGEDDKAGFFRRPEMQRWFRTLAEEFAADGTLRVHRLDIGSLNAAMTVSLVDPVDTAQPEGRTWGLYNSSFDPSLAALAPGMVLVWELIERATAEACTMFDLLRGDEPYKYRFGATDREVRTLSLARP
jgi:CelD/BcsL family acetyltransferase involved in cellulose biosynthesis